MGVGAPRGARFRGRKTGGGLRWMWAPQAAQVGVVGRGAAGGSGPSRPGCRVRRGVGLAQRQRAAGEWSLRSLPRFARLAADAGVGLGAEAAGRQAAGRWRGGCGWRRRRVLAHGRGGTGGRRSHVGALTPGARGEAARGEDAVRSDVGAGQEAFLSKGSRSWLGGWRRGDRSVAGRAFRRAAGGGGAGGGPGWESSPARRRRVGRACEGVDGRRHRWRRCRARRGRRRGSRWQGFRVVQGG